MEMNMIGGEIVEITPWELTRTTNPEETIPELTIPGEIKKGWTCNKADKKII